MKIRELTAMFRAKISVKKGCPIADSLNLLHNCCCADNYFLIPSSSLAMIAR